MSVQQGYDGQVAEAGRDVLADAAYAFLAFQQPVMVTSLRPRPRLEGDTGAGSGSGSSLLAELDGL